MIRPVLMEGYRPGGREIFVSKGPINDGYQPTGSAPAAPGSAPAAPPRPAPNPPTGGSAISKPTKT